MFLKRSNADQSPQRAIARSARFALARVINPRSRTSTFPPRAESGSATDVTASGFLMGTITRLRKRNLERLQPSPRLMDGVRWDGAKVQVRCLPHKLEITQPHVTSRELFFRLHKLESALFRLRTQKRNSTGEEGSLFRSLMRNIKPGLATSVEITQAGSSRPINIRTE